MRQFAKEYFLAFMVAATLAGLVRYASAEDERKRPDIVIIIGDDIGYSDFGCYGGEIPNGRIIEGQND